MRNSFLFMMVVGLVFSGTAFALTANLDANAIKHIHGQIVISFNANCKKTLSSSADAICSCLAGKANDYLDDDALSQCANDDTGISCVSKSVASASMKALSKENIAACTQQTTTVSQTVADSSAATRGSAASATSPTQDDDTSSGMTSADSNDANSNVNSSSNISSNSHSVPNNPSRSNENIGSSGDDGSDTTDNGY